MLTAGLAEDVVFGFDDGGDFAGDVFGGGVSTGEWVTVLVVDCDGDFTVAICTPEDPVLRPLAGGAVSLNF